MKLSKYIRTYLYQIQNMKRWDFEPSQTKIIISLTTVPSRIRWLKPTLISLLRQRPDVIELNLAKTPLKQDVAWEIPQWLTALSAVKIFWLDQDYGPASKFIPTIERHAGEDCKICVVDDDMIYPQDFLSNLIQAHRTYNKPAVFCTSGHKIWRNLDSSQAPLSENQGKDPVRVGIIHGCGGYIFQPNYFDLAQLKAINTLPTDSAKQDDVWISGLLSQSHIPKFRIKVGKRSGTINTLTASITGARVPPFNHVLAYFKDAWQKEELVD